MKILEAENVLPYGYLEYIKAHVKSNLIWSYDEGTSNDTGVTDLWDKHMCCVMVNHERNYTYKDNPMFSFFYPIVYILEEKFGVRIKYVERMKVNKTFTKPCIESVHPWHIDSYTPNAVSIVLYLNTTDGGTVISGVTMDHATPQEELSLIKRMELQDKNNFYVVEAKENKAVLFPSNLVHHGELPKNTACKDIINIVAVIE